MVLQDIIPLLHDIKGNGTFAVSGTKNLIVPGIRIEGFGEVSFPLEINQIQSLINTSNMAPFGKGSKTIYDDSGSFFLPHKDSEKEKGMFGTLVIGLPSKY